ncbi:NLR family CARD domain-containing protein 3-like isoform X1 [Mugil cephalus]|uniref:NLR family CARD domain-containing protein 3-like isoform X1 n=2 Tax=Mugil cephalus TaxID=48193 RepID=UPI001FB74538|nr:NLR family CARD domain-containing protein 3-like isoform X1 [Mugil cephalus]
MTVLNLICACKIQQELSLKMDPNEETERSPDGEPPAKGRAASMCSDASMEHRIVFAKEAADSPFYSENTPAFSCASMKSDSSMEAHHEWSNKDSDRSFFRDHHGCPELTEVDGNVIFELVETHIIDRVKSEMKRYKNVLFPHLPQSSESKEESEDSEATEDKKQNLSTSEEILKMTLQALNEIGRQEIANKLQKYIYGELDVCQRKLKHKLKKFEYIYEGIAQHGNQTLLNKVYTELYVTEGVSGGVNEEHEVRQIEAATRRPETEDKPIKCEDIFKPMCGQDRPIRTVLTRGIAGIGKTISVQKFNLEWAEGRVNQDIHLLINLPFRELNLMKERKYTLTQLLHQFLMEAKESGISNFGKYKLVLIFDGLDECRLPLDFSGNGPCRCVSEEVSVDVLLTSLFRGNLLPSAHIWITSRPAAANRIPGQLIDRVTEIRGFNDPQKEEYFKKKIPDQTMASRVISHIKSNRSLHIMCHIPVFSWISATVLQRILEDTVRREEEGEGRREMPNTLTKMYTHFLVYNSVIRGQKYPAGQEASEAQDQVKMNEEIILKLGKLAFEHLMKGNMIFYENELKEYNINANAAVYSGMLTQMSGSDSGFHLERIFCFVHFSIQEFFAAMYIFHTFVCFNQNLLEPHETSAVETAPCEVTDLLKSAVDKALQSDNGHLDLLLRFLLGLSQTSNLTLLKSLLTKMPNSPLGRNEEIAEYIKEKIRQNPSPERCVNLFHCLVELHDQSLLEEIQNYLSSGRLSETELSPSQWSALVFVLLTSEEKLDEFDLRKYSRSEEGLRRLLPVIKESRVAVLKECNLTEECCEMLAAAVNSSILKELDLSDNDLQDAGIKLLSAGLERPTCQLETLRLAFCGITETGCGLLVTALRSNPGHLKKLDLSYNHPGQKGMEMLTSVQKEIAHLTVRFDNSGECYLKSALKKYSCELTLDLNTAHSYLSFSEDKKQMTRMETAQLYPDSPERFTDWGQVLCRETLCGRCYWEAEWTGEWAGIGVAYKGISRDAKGNECALGNNDQSWSLRYYKGEYSFWYNKNYSTIFVPYFNSKRVGVFLDWSAGTLSFYAVSTHTMTHLYTFHTKFSEPLYPGFRLGFPNSSLTLCQPGLNTHSIENM